MSPVSKYPKGVAKQQELIDVALRVVAERGYNGATITEVADAANLSKAGLLHHFRKKEDLFAEVLRRRDDLVTDTWTRERMNPTVDGATLIAGFIRENAKVPGLVQLFTRLSAEATDPSNPAHDYFRDRYEKNREASASLLQDMQASGRLPSTADPEMFAVILAALQDGLQLRWLYDPHVDMAAHLEHFFDALAARVPDLDVTP
ncbi:TetR/AcrR family transcriptional regulator [Microbacterium rhizomatis]|uniref:TetR family transcriptional regulator n=1 Tax=Microbacterium rhizomatis TaxID=1631477 RepID=A0A5J5IWN2_9MICO|nr:TetR family transcriptional regulator [Microbacterium rhizomatis]KAA9105881.1 TetR family transcriptional regulator [Microbacterium rhizomatis]